MNEVWKVVLAVLTSVGGISGLIILAIKIWVSTIAERLEQTYSLKLDKELEKYKSNLDNKIYISKTKFDNEEDYLASTMYNDYVINRHLFHWESQNNTGVDTPTSQRYIRNEEGHKVLLFVR